NFTTDLPQVQIRNSIISAVSLWSQVTPLTFTEDTNNPDISISFATTQHGDPDPFDGPGTVVAHAFPPPPGNGTLPGDVHFDDDETWTDNIPPGGIDLFSVATHEIGHSLGLNHSSLQASIMFKDYLGAHRWLHIEDISRIQALYSARIYSQNIVGMASTPNGEGYWLVDNTGAVYTFGNTMWYGGSNQQPGAPEAVGM